jgi:hypothetical protein
MADWDTLFRSNEFAAYRKYQAELIACIIHDHTRRLLNGAGNADRLSGQMEMAKAMLDLPGKLTEDEELHNILQIQLERDIASIDKYLMREFLQDD